MWRIPSSWLKKRINLEIYTKINYIRIKYFVNIPVRTDYFSNWFYELTAPVFALQFKWVINKLSSTLLVVRQKNFLHMNSTIDITNEFQSSISFLMSSTSLWVREYWPKPPRAILIFRYELITNAVSRDRCLFVDIGRQKIKVKSQNRFREDGVISRPW